MGGPSWIKNLIVRDLEGRRSLDAGSGDDEDRPSRPSRLSRLSRLSRPSPSPSSSGAALVRVADVVNRTVVELLACMMFHFIGSVSPTPWANGIALMVLVYFSAKISGAHLNPAVTLTFCLLGHTPPSEVLAYWAAQVAGCALGALWIACLVPGLAVRATPDGPFAALYGCFVPNESLSDLQVFAWEAVCTCSFIIPVFSVVWYSASKYGYGTTGPLIVGLSLLANALACGQFTGASLNPARTVASPIVFACPRVGSTYAYVLGELLGGTVAVVAIVPWYGISRHSWYAAVIPTWAIAAARRTQRTIVLEAIKEHAEPPPAAPEPVQPAREPLPRRQVSSSEGGQVTVNVAPMVASRCNTL